MAYADETVLGEQLFAIPRANTKLKGKAPIIVIAIGGLCLCFYPVSTMASIFRITSVKADSNVNKLDFHPLACLSPTVSPKQPAQATLVRRFSVPPTIKTPSCYLRHSF